MGIHGLTKLLGDNAHECIKEQKFDSYFGRKIAVDASMHIYQFLIVVGRQASALRSSGVPTAGGRARWTERTQHTPIMACSVASVGAAYDAC